MPVGQVGHDRHRIRDRLAIHLQRRDLPRRVRRQRLVTVALGNGLPFAKARRDKPVRREAELILHITHDRQSAGLTEFPVVGIFRVAPERLAVGVAVDAQDPGQIRRHLVAEIEQDVRVDSVDGASRHASGWTVSGTLFNGSAFNCEIDNNGRVSSVDYSGFSGVGYDEGAAEGQWSDAQYSEARASLGDREYVAADIRPMTPPASSAGDEPQPAYPGGPLPGEEGYPGG